MTVKEDFKVDVKVYKWPYRSFKQFKAFAQQHTGDHYWPAINLLLERSKRLEIYEGKSVGETVETNEDLEENE